MLALCEALLVTVCVEIAGRVGGVDLVHEDYLSVPLAELVLGVYQDETALCSYLRTALEQGQRVFLKLCVFVCGDNAAGDDFLPADVLVVAFCGLGRRGDDGLGKLLVLLQAVRKGDAAEAALSGLVLAPGVSGEVSADHHLHLVRLAAPAHGDHGIDGGNLPVGKDVLREVEELGGDLVQDLPLVGNSLRQHYVEGGNTVSGHHYEAATVEGVNVTDFSRIF